VCLCVRLSVSACVCVCMCACVRAYVCAGQPKFANRGAKGVTRLVQRDGAYGVSVWIPECQKPLAQYQSMAG
jgi:hypothetical protein